MITIIFLVAGVLLAALALLLFIRVISGVAFAALAIVIVLIAALAGTKISQFKAMGSAKWAPPAQPVTAAVADEQTWQPTLFAVGSLTAVQGVTISAQLDGNVTKIGFVPGSAVKAGDLILQQDISSEEAQLHAAQAAAELARINLQRSRELLASATIAQSQFDSDDAVYKQNLAQVENIRALIEKKTIRAPFSGRLGVRLVDLGQTLKAGDPIVSLQALDPIFADFYLPQQDLARLVPGLKVGVASDGAAAGQVLGKITAINPDVDSATRNVRVEATLANPQEKLRPGMYVDVQVELPVGEKVLVIPSTSVLYAPYGDSVFLIENNQDGTGKVVRQQFVRLGERRGDFVAVNSGLKKGDTVVTTGAFTLHNGTLVRIDNKLAPDAKLAPQPDDS